jgi:hypothetical protein
MDKVIAARGDAVTYSIDKELSLQFQEMSQELEKAIAINQELYDRGSELAERVVELEAKVAELEQEAEQLAMQLQNAWSVGYQKGLAEGKEKATSTGDSPAVTPKQVAEVIPAPKVVMSARDQAVQSGAESAVQTGEEPPVLAETLAAQDTEYVHIEDQERDNSGFTVDDLPSHAQIQPGASEEVVGYNDKVFNAVKEGPAGPKPSDLYSALSFKQIETVYQYSNVQGRVGANLYFEPLPSAQSMEEAENEPVANSAVQPVSPAAPAPEARPVTQPTAAPSQVEPEQIHTPAPVEPEQKQAQKQETEPAAAAEQAERRPKKMPNISFDPPDEPIVGASSRKRIEGMADSFADTFGQDPFTQSLTDVPSLDNMLNLGSGGNGYDVPQAKVPPPAAPQPYSQFAPPQEQAPNSRSAEVETSSALTALPTSEPNDELDLDKLDIFEGLEDIEELSNIEVIEDVVLPGDPSAAQRSTTDKATAIGGEDLRDLIKTRIKQAHEQPGEADAQGQTPGSGTPSAPATAAAAAQAAQDASALSAEAIRQGVRNKFIGGKSPTVPPPGIANPAATAAAGGAGAAAPAAGPSTGAGAAAGAGAATASTDTAPGAAPGASASQQQAAAAARVPPEVRKNCMILGVRPEDLTVKNVIDAWKAQITAPGVHPDQGGDHETALYLNIAKETLVKYIEAQAPKLGKKFGQQAQARETPKAPFTMRQNPDKGTDKK